MEDEKIKNETEAVTEEPKGFVHMDNQADATPAQPGMNAEESAQQEAAAKRKRKTWITVGIILLIVVGIPLILFGTCLLIFARG